MLILTLCATILLAGSPNIAHNSDFTSIVGDLPRDYLLSGAARFEYAGYRDEFASKGVILDSAQSSGSVSQTLDIDRTQGKWITFRIRGKAEGGFAVGQDQLYLQMEFLGDHGKTYQDKVRRLIYREITRDRQDMAVNGDDHKSGAAVWRTYGLEELLPFAQTDAVRFTVGFENGQGTGKPYTRFMIDEFDVYQDTGSHEGKVDPADRIKIPAPNATSTDGMISLGGRWYYKPANGETVKLPLKVTEANSDRLFYKDDRLENPFEGNMTAWLRRGMKDEQGRVATVDRFIPDNVVLEFDGSDTFTIHAKNIPNHPTARFPDTYGTQGYNPNYIQEHDYAWRIPITPHLQSDPRPVDAQNTGMALPMGAIGVAINGVVFYNPFDAGMQDATGIMDRCCGHPSPDNRYHYHKYPICVNTPFLDKGDAHSPLIGFAFDGLPIYGPYESHGVMAKDSTDHPLNAFNAHYDAVRGWHYHVTPGKFPYVIGGFFATPQEDDLEGQ
jgi:hypothetical protein